MQFRKQSTFVGIVDDLRLSAALLDYAPPFGRFSFLLLFQFLGGFLTQQQLYTYEKFVRFEWRKTFRKQTRGKFFQENLL